MGERLLQPYAAQILEADPRPLVLFVTTAAPPVMVCAQNYLLRSPGLGTPAFWPRNGFGPAEGRGQQAVSPGRRHRWTGETGRTGAACSTDINAADAAEAACPPGDPTRCSGLCAPRDQGSNGATGPGISSERVSHLSAPCFRILYA